MVQQFFGLHDFSINYHSQIGTMVLKSGMAMAVLASLAMRYSCKEVYNTAPLPLGRALPTSLKMGRLEPPLFQCL